MRHAIYIILLLLYTINNLSFTKKVLVTGGAGFIGSHLCKKLLEMGHHVIAIDNFATSSIDNIRALLSNKNFTFIKHDIIKPIDLEIDWIFNFACPASPPLYQKDPIFTLKTNFIGSLNMLELARKNNARILQASTSEVYGNPLQHPQTESYWGNVNPIGPRACYDEGKRVAETLFFDYHRMFNLDIKVIRIFNTYGPHMNIYDGRVISNFVNKALKDKNLEIYGDGKQTRSFCYIDDLITGIITMMETNKEVTGPVNLGNPNEEMTIHKLANTIIKLTQSNSKIIFKPLPKDDPVKRRPDITLTKKILGWKPKISIKKGLKKYIQFYSKRYIL